MSPRNNGTGSYAVMKGFRDVFLWESTDSFVFLIVRRRVALFRQKKFWKSNYGKMNECQC